MSQQPVFSVSLNNSLWQFQIRAVQNVNTTAPNSSTTLKALTSYLLHRVKAPKDRLQRPGFTVYQTCPFFLPTAIIPPLQPFPASSSFLHFQTCRGSCARTRVCLCGAPGPGENRENRERAHIPGLNPPVYFTPSSSSSSFFTSSLHSTARRGHTRSCRQKRGKELTVYQNSALI